MPEEKEHYYALFSYNDVDAKGNRSNDHGTYVKYSSEDDFRKIIRDELEKEGLNKYTKEEDIDVLMRWWIKVIHGVQVEVYEATEEDYLASL